MALTTILGKKVGMTQVYDADGILHPVTVVQAGPCTVLQVKQADGKDGYNAVQLGFGDKKPKRATRPLLKHCEKAGAAGPKQFIREVRLPGKPELAPGESVTVQGFVDDNVVYVDVVGVSKGRGYAGVMKRHGFGGQPATHGTERKHRSPGSISMGMNRGHGRGLRLGKKMTGHMGDVRVTSKHNRLVRVDAENNLLLIRGAIPGAPGGFVLVRRSHTRRQQLPQVKK